MVDFHKYLCVRSEQLVIESAPQSFPMELPSRSRKSITVGSYVLGEEIGKGAHGVVYKAICVNTGAVVAVKEIGLRKLDSESSKALKLEIDLLTKLRHENVVELIGVVEHHDYVYVILEFIENGSLSSLIKPGKFGKLTENLAKVYVKQLLTGLHFCHVNGVVHRDVKGGNVLTTKDGVVKICDFGVAMRVTGVNNSGNDGTNSSNSDTFSKQIDPQGTPYWMAPEVIEMGEGVSFASDVWSVGCVVLELLTGEPPYFQMQPMPAMFAIVRDKRPPIPVNFSHELTEFLKLCWRKDPSKRPSCAQLLKHEWLSDVEEVTESQKRNSAKNKNTNALPPALLSVEIPTGPVPTMDDSEDDSEEEELEWAAPEFTQDARRRKVKVVPPSSPFQVAPVMDFTEKPNVEQSYETKSAYEGNEKYEPSPAQGDLAVLEQKTVQLSNQIAEGSNGAVKLFTEFYAEVVKASGCFRGEDTPAEKNSIKNSTKMSSQEFCYSPASCDAALANANVADILVNRVEDEASSSPDITDLMELLCVLITASSNPKNNKVGKFTGAFCLLRGVRVVLNLLEKCLVLDDIESASLRTSCVNVMGHLVRLGGVTSNTVVSCGGLKVLTKLLTSQNYSGFNRVTIRGALNAIFSTCFPKDAYFLNWETGGDDRVDQLEPQSRMGKQSDDDESFGLDADVNETSSDGVTSASIASGAAARAGLAPALATLLAHLNVAAREEAGSGGTPKHGSGNSSNDPTSCTPSGRARDACALALGKVLSAPGNAGSIARHSTFAKSIQSTHAFLAVVGSLAVPEKTTTSLLRILRFSSRDPHVAAGMRASGATPKLARCLQREDSAIREHALRALRNVCLLGEGYEPSFAHDESRGTVPPVPSATALEHAVVAGITPHLVVLAVGDDGRFVTSDDDNLKNNGKTDGGGAGFGIVNGFNGDARHWQGDGGLISHSLRQVAVDLLCACAGSGSRMCRAKLLEQNAVDALVSLAFPRVSSDGKARKFEATQYPPNVSRHAVNAIHTWLGDEPWAVEARLMEPDVIAAAVAVVAEVQLDAGGRRSPKNKNSQYTSALDGSTINSIEHLVTSSVRWAGALCQGGVVEKILTGLEKVIGRCEMVFSEGGDLSRSQKNELSNFVAAFVTSRVSLLSKLADTDSKAKEWLQKGGVVEKIDSLGLRMDKVGGDGAVTDFGDAAAATRETGDKLRRKVR